MTAFGFNENDAKRIGKVVRLVERNPDKPSLGGPDYGGRSPGVRLLIAQHAGSSWAANSTAVVTVYNGPPGSVASALTVVAYNQYMKFAEDTACTNRWVSLGHNGFGWSPVDSLSDCDGCISEIGGIDFRILPGYARTTEQILGHDNSGCIKWFDVYDCSTAA